MPRKVSSECVLEAYSAPRVHMAGRSYVGARLSCRVGLAWPHAPLVSELPSSEAPLAWSSVCRLSSRALAPCTRRSCVTTPRSCITTAVASSATLRSSRGEISSAVENRTCGHRRTRQGWTTAHDYRTETGYINRHDSTLDQSLRGDQDCRRRTSIRSTEMHRRSDGYRHRRHRAC